MKSNMNLMLFAVYFSGLVIALNATPVTTDEGDTPEKRPSDVPITLARSLSNMVLTDEGGPSENKQIPECLKSYLAPMVKSSSCGDLNKMATSLFNLQKNINDVSADLMKNEFKSSIPLKLQEDFLKIASYARTLILGKCIQAGRNVLTQAIRDCFDPFVGNKLEIKIKELVDRFVREVQAESENPNV